MERRLPCGSSLMFRGDDVDGAVLEHTARTYGLTDMKALKHGQSHIYSATMTGSGGERAVVVRVAPRDADRNVSSAEDEGAFLCFLAEFEVNADISFCEAIPVPTATNFAIENGEHVILVFRHASYSPVPGVPSDRAFLRAWGRALGKIHAASSAWLRARAPSPDIQRNRWDQLHGGLWHRSNLLQEGSKAYLEHHEVEAWIEALGEEEGADPTAYGLVHGDFIPGNMHAMRNGDVVRLDIFDFDQLSLAYYAYDLGIVASFLYYVSSHGGLEGGVDDAFATVVDGYHEEHTLGGSAEAEARWMATLPRFTHLRLRFYYMVCLENLASGTLPDGAATFMQGYADWYDGEQWNFDGPVLSSLATSSTVV